MGKLNFASYKSQRSVELMALAKILKKIQIVQDTKPIEDAANECLSRKPTGRDDSWGYRIRDLLFQQVEDLRKVRPKSLSKSNINVTLDVDFAAQCMEHDGNSVDGISELTVNLLVSDQSKQFRQSWHFDRHIQKPTDPKPIAAHPLYHFQSGGRHILNFEDDFFGSVLFVEGPRIAHPPMDGLLAIDFVLSNYFGTKWRSLANNHDYRQLIGGMQRKIWRPYASSFNSTWLTPTGVYNWGDPIEIFPQIVRETKTDISSSNIVRKRRK